MGEETLVVTATSHSGIDGAALADDCWGHSVPPLRVLLASVAGGELVTQLSRWMERAWQLTPEIIETKGEGYGVTVAYQQPWELGVDRWLALIAARQGHDRPLCVVDSGTAMTVDLLGYHGKHLGGMIMPGIGVMRDVLFERTQIPYVAQVAGDELLGRDTASCIAAASLHAAGALVDRVMARITDQLGVMPDLLFTGSGAQQLMMAVEHSGQYVPDLVLQGLRCIAEGGNKS